jgi:hypothetical protein
MARTQLLSSSTKANLHLLNLRTQPEALPTLVPPPQIRAYDATALSAPDI